MKMLQTILPALLVAALAGAAAYITVPAKDVASAARAPLQAAQQWMAPQVPPELREFIPIPGPGDQNPGRGQSQDECEPVILFYHEGRLYRLQPGPRDGQGRPTVPPEFFPLEPYQGPSIPGLPFPRQERGPGPRPANPRL